jgi:nicotine blue oxidoreductase
MGGPKALLRDRSGEAWVTRSARVLVDGGCAPVLVVVGARGTEVAALVPAGCQVVPAAGWAEGMGASVRAGLSALAEVAGPDVVAVLVGLVDTPGVTAGVVRLLVAQAGDVGPDGLARAGYGGAAGHPVVLGRAHWAGVMASARGDVGARGYLAGRDVVLIDCSIVGDGRDIDAPGPPLS